MFKISLPLEDARESLKSSPMESNPDSLDGLSPVSELLNSPSIPAIYTDVNVVPEYVKNELEPLDKRRREALNKILDIKGSIRVFCHVRPFLLTDKRRIHEPISTGSEKIVVQRKEFELDNFSATSKPRRCFC
ncbi:hypothetical protein I3843_12G000200 [Carya illinoinensis]|nr:hypothetical protein I3843_12G000200 [Carya illinoinensis]